MKTQEIKNAEEARLLTDSANSDLNKLLRNIQYRASKGIGNLPTYQLLSEKLRGELAEKGFKITTEKDRDGSYYIISW